MTNETKEMNYLQISLIFAFICLPLQADDPVVKGVILESNQSLVATNKNGSVKISYVSPTKRKYTWDNQSRVLKMTIQDWVDTNRLGKIHPSFCGIYNAGDVWFFNPYNVRIVSVEGTMNFKSEKDIYAFLYQGSEVMYWVYTSDGLLFGFGRVPKREAINIDLYQILLDGKKPHDLKGSSNNLIRIINSDSP
jgi:hypothetical protein